MTTPGRWNGPKPSSGRSATTTSSWSRRAPTRTRRDPGPSSARAALALALSVLLRLLAPFLAFVTEEVWSWWHEGSVHRSPWPRLEELPAATGGATTDVLDMASEILGAVRRTKSEAKVSMRAVVERLTVVDSSERLGWLSEAAQDVCEAAGVINLDTSIGTPSVHVVLAEAQSSNEAGTPG